MHLCAVLTMGIRRRRLLLPIFLAGVLAVRVEAGALLRPLVADPRESLARWRIVTSVEDWRYGTDITDSTSRGGVVEDRTRIVWEGAAGHTFRWRPWQRPRSNRLPFVAAQLVAPAAIYATFDNSGSLLNTDYLFGGGLDLQWSGADVTLPVDATTGVGEASAARPFDRPVVTSRLTITHHSSHLGDEYIALSRFGRNQSGHPRAGALFDHPPVKRVDLSYEAVTALLSCEWAPRWNQARGVARVYAGGEAKLVLPAAWEIGALRPHNFRTASARVGLEYRAAGNGARAPAGRLTSLANRTFGGRRVETSWFGAFDLRLAKPYNFASGDNRDGEDEVWTPRLWTETPYGREYRHYAGSWHAMLGAVVWPRAAAETRTPLTGSEWLFSLEWYRGYSFNGQFLDQRSRWHPRWYVVPSVTARF